MKILHLIDSAGLYGAERMLLDLVEQQNRAGMESSILSSTNDVNVTKPLVIAGRDRALDVIEWPMSDGLNLFQAIRIVKFARAQGVTVLHSHGYKFNILLGILPGFIRRLPRVCTVHGYLAAPRGSKLWWYQQLDRHLLARADATVFVSRAMLSQPAFRGLSIRNPRVIYNGIDFEGLRVGARGADRTDFRSLYFGTETNDRKIKLIVAVGRLTAEKGYSDLIRAFKNVKAAEPDTRLLIAGEGPERVELEQLCKDLDLEESVVMPGFVSPVSPLFDQLDVLVMSSYTEGMPMTLLEAVAANARIVATRVGGIPEVLEGYGKSLLVPAGSVDQLGVAMLQALAGKVGMDFEDVSVFASRFSSAAMECSYRDLYAEVIG